jgi:hypothetical protein
MKMNLWLALPAALTAFAFSQPVSAAVVTYTYSGVIDFGADDFGLFGDAGASLTGASFTAVFYRDDALALPENIFQGETNSSVNGEGAFSPVSAKLTIAGVALDIGGVFGEQTQFDDGAYESFGHSAGGFGSSIDFHGNTLGTFAPTAGDVLAGPDYHTLTSLTLAGLGAFDLYGTFNFVDPQAKGLRTFANFNPTSLVVSPIPGGGPAPAPEPSTWALMILGFGGVGATLRRRRVAALA